MRALPFEAPERGHERGGRGEELGGEPEPAGDLREQALYPLGWVTVGVHRPGEPENEADLVAAVVERVGLPRGVGHRAFGCTVAKWLRGKDIDRVRVHQGPRVALRLSELKLSLPAGRLYLKHFLPDDSRGTP